MNRRRNRDKIEKELRNTTQKQQEAQAAIVELTQTKTNLEEDIIKLSEKAKIELHSANDHKIQKEKHTLKLPTIVEDKYFVENIKARMKVKFNRLTCTILGIALWLVIMWKCAN